MTDDVFTAPLDEVVTDQVDYAAEMAKKFPDGKGGINIEAVFKGKFEADNMVEKVLLEKKVELERLQRELETRMSVEEMLTKAVSTTPSTSTSHTPTVTANESAKETSPQNIESLVEDVLRKKQQVATQEQNVNFVRQELTKQYGANYAQVLERKAAELDLSVDDVRELARTKPKMVLDLMAKTTQPVHMEAPRSTMRTPQGVAKNEAYYQNLRRTNPEAYRSPEVQAERKRNALEMGTAFFR